MITLVDNLFCSTLETSNIYFGIIPGKISKNISLGTSAFNTHRTSKSHRGYPTILPHLKECINTFYSFYFFSLKLLEFHMEGRNNYSVPVRGNQHFDIWERRKSMEMCFDMQSSCKYCLFTYMNLAKFIVLVWRHECRWLYWELHWKVSKFQWYLSFSMGKLPSVPEAKALPFCSKQIYNYFYFMRESKFKFFLQGKHKYLCSWDSQENVIIRLRYTPWYSLSDSLVGPLHRASHRLQ